MLLMAFSPPLPEQQRPNEWGGKGNALRMMSPSSGFMSTPACISSSPFLPPSFFFFFSLSPFKSHDAAVSMSKVDGELLGLVHRHGLFSPPPLFSFLSTAARRAQSRRKKKRSPSAKRTYAGLDCRLPLPPLSLSFLLFPLWKRGV